MSKPEIPVCLELHHSPNRPPLVCGILAIGDDGNPAHFANLEEAAIFFATTGLIPVSIPDEEGWEQTQDLPLPMWEDLLRMIDENLRAKE